MITASARGAIRLATAAFFTAMLGTTAAVAAEGPQVHRVSGLDEVAVIRRDANGIVHITAADEPGMAFAQGYVHARDRLFQMDQFRHIGSGTLAELLGPDVIPDDVELRTLGLRRAAEQTWPRLGSELRAALVAYAKGVNAYKNANPMPAEYGVLGLSEIGDWTPLDSVTIAKLLAFQLSADTDDIAREEALSQYEDRLGLEDGQDLFFEDTWRAAPFVPVATVPGIAAAGVGQATKPQSSRSAVAGGNLRALTATWHKRLARAPYFRQLLSGHESVAASNAFVISGSLTANKQPLLANDPHLNLVTPSFFYPIALRTLHDGFDVSGASFPGLPYILQGITPQFAWGVTSSNVDVTDIYSEQLVLDPDSPSKLSTLYQGEREFVMPIPQTFRANVDGELVKIPVPLTEGGLTLIVPRRNGGPIISLSISQSGLAALSLQWSGFGPTFDIEGFRLLNRAKTLADFEAGLQRFDAVTQNVLYADRAGNIAYYLSGEIPLREDLQAETVDRRWAPFLIRSGQGGQEWLPASNPPLDQALPYAILPPDEMPKAINPEVGYLINANNELRGDTFDNDAINQKRPGGGIYYLSADFKEGIRAKRIEQLIDPQARGAGLSLADLQAMQADVVMFDATIFVHPHIVRAFEAVDEDSDERLRALAANPAIAEAVGRLKAWRFTAPTGVPEGYDAADKDGQLLPMDPGEIEESIAATIYSLWRSQMIANTIDETLGDLQAPPSRYAIRVLRHLLDTFDDNHGIGASGLNFFKIPEPDADPATRRDIIILQSLRDALDRLASDDFKLAFGNSTNQDDYRWGKLHRLSVEHPLGGRFSMTSPEGPFPPPFPNLPGIPVDGGFETLDRSAQNARAGLAGRDDPLNDFVFAEGPIDRFVVSFGGAANRAENALPGGISGEPAIGSEPNPLFANLFGPWLTNEAYRMGRCRGHCESLEVLIPDSAAP